MTPRGTQAAARKHHRELGDSARVAGQSGCHSRRILRSSGPVWGGTWSSRPPDQGGTSRAREGRSLAYLLMARGANFAAGMSDRPPRRGCIGMPREGSVARGGFSSRNPWAVLTVTPHLQVTGPCRRRLSSDPRSPPPARQCTSRPLRSGIPPARLRHHPRPAMIVDEEATRHIETRLETAGTCVTHLLILADAA